MAAAAGIVNEPPRDGVAGIMKTALIAPLVTLASLLLFTSLAAAAENKPPVKVLIITGDHAYHPWKETTPFLKDTLTKAGMQVDVTTTPAKDLTPDNLAKYDCLLLNYKQSNQPPPDTKWTDENKKALADAVRIGGKGLFVYHFASAAFTEDKDPWSKDYEQLIAGGWRKQGFHGKRHEYDVTVKPIDHPITKDLAGTYHHSNDELYQNSLIPDGATVLVTAYSDKAKDPKNTGKDEPMVWVSKYGDGRVCNNALGHDVAAMSNSPIFQVLLVRGVEWAASGECHAQPPAELEASKVPAR
jgi:type 1 glutamine amidotransferase